MAFKSGLKLRLMKGTPYLTIQGEGVRVGESALFIRTAGCDLRCHRDRKLNKFWTCDTPLSLPDYKPSEGKFREEPTEHAYEVAPEELAAQIQGHQHWSRKPVVITGGEPMLQADALVCLLSEMHMPPGTPLAATHVTIETNARRYSEALANYIDLPSLSPKLQVYGQEEEDTIKAWAKHCARFKKQLQLKIVCCDEADYRQALWVFDMASELCEVERIVQPGETWANVNELAGLVARENLCRLIPQTHKWLKLP